LSHLEAKLVLGLLQGLFLGRQFIEVLPVLFATAQMIRLMVVLAKDVLFVEHLHDVLRWLAQGRPTAAIISNVMSLGNGLAMFFRPSGTFRRPLRAS